MMTNALASLAAVLTLCLGMGMGLFSPVALAQGASLSLDPEPSTSGPVRLRQTPAPSRNAQRRDDADLTFKDAISQPPAASVVRRPGEFERHVNRLIAPEMVTRFGAELVESRNDATDVQDFNPLVPPDYLVQPGDEIALAIWGSVDADLRLTVDRSGRVTIPRVGTVMVSGVRYGDLTEVISKRIGQVFRNYQLSVSLGQLRGVRVYVTGFVNRPGAVNVSSLSTVTGVLLAAGGPSAAGSMRVVQVRRGRDLVATLDLYDLLLRGDRANDRTVQADDVIHVGPIGTEVGLIGSVNRPGIFELKPGETVTDLLRMAGGLSAVADRQRLYVERLGERNTFRVAELALPADYGARLDTGDVVRALSAVEATRPLQLKNKRVRVEGEVIRPGEYVLPGNSTISEALAAAGGLLPSAYVYGTEFSRVSVRATQQENYDRALRDLETDITRRGSTQRASSADEAAAQNTMFTNSSRLIQRLRMLKPSGRIVLELQPDTKALPDLLLEDGDRMFIPPRPTTVGVFGSVFNPGSYLFTGSRGLEEYLRLAGGATKGADSESLVVVRANGSVVNTRQRQQGWFRSGTGLRDVPAEPGDTIFVPEEVDKTNFTQNAKDWTTILYNLGVGAAALNSIFK